MLDAVPFDALSTADLVVGTLYRGGSAGNVSDDPISRLLGCGNQGGFRYRGSVQGLNLNYVILYTNLSDPDWPDCFEEETGRFTYFGDNKSPMYELHDTQKGESDLTRDVRSASPGQTSSHPTLLCFQKRVLW